MKNWYVANGFVHTGTRKFEQYRQQGIHDFQLFTGDDNLNAQEFYEHIGYRSDNEVVYRKRDIWNKNT